MRRILSAHLFIALLTAQFAASPIHGQTPEYGSATLQAGSMTLTISRGGEIAPQIQAAADGLLWPGAPALVPHQNVPMRRLLFSATPVFVGSVRGEVRASASYYRDNHLPGPVLPGLRTVNPRDPRYRAFTIRIGDETAQDFQDWPVDLGAPVDSTFEPLFYGSPQMFWVMNDLDTAKMRANMGSDPMGLELRCLAFPLSSLSALGDDATLLQITWINHSPDSIRNAFAGFFADVDIRDGFQERAGSDSVRGLAYVYHDDDAGAGAEGMPAAFGISMLQTPIVFSSNDSARWSNGMKIGYRNLPVTSGITPLKSVPSPVAEPELGEGGEAWLALMKGEGRGTTVLNPLTGAPTGFWFSGDPAGTEGWQMEDGFLFGNGATTPFGPRDQRVLISSGPFDLAPGDTQQVVIALIAARAATGKAAAYLLRDRADFLRQYWQRRNAIAGFATASVRHDPEVGGGSSLRFTARSSSAADSVEADVTTPDGATLARVPLMALQQGTNTLYTGSVTLPAAVEGVNAGFIVRDGGETHRLPGRVSIPRAGAIEGRGAEILEEYDGNGRIAPDDYARWMPRLYNSADHALVLRIEHPSLDYLQWMQIPGLPARTTAPSDAWPWQPAFGARGVPPVTEGWGTDFDSTFFEYDIYETGTNSWWQLRNWVQVDSTAGEWYDALMTRVRSGSEQLPGVIIRDLDLLQDRWYVARITEGAETRMLSLYDSATGGLIFSDHALDGFNGQAPVTDGFRVVRGTIGSRYTGYALENVEGLQPSANGMFPLRIGENNFEDAERRDFRVEFTTDGLQYWQYAERGYEGRIRLPLRAFYREDDGSWTPALASLHETGTDIPDGDPNPDGGDYLMLYQLPYDAEAAPEVLYLPESTLDFPAPLLLQLSGMPTTGSMEITYPIPVSPGDVFAFNPRHFLMAKSNKAPAAATLHPPAPMPFSAWTSALLELQQPGTLRVEVYNSLGQRVRVLFDGMRDAGKHLMVWDGYWSDGRPAETGMYLLRAETGGREITRKLMLAR